METKKFKQDFLKFKRPLKDNIPQNHIKTKPKAIMGMKKIWRVNLCPLKILLTVRPMAMKCRKSSSLGTEDDISIKNIQLDLILLGIN